MTDRVSRLATRGKLVEMRERLIEDLVDGIDGGGLARLNEIHGAIAAIDAERVGSPLAHGSLVGGDDASDRASPHSGPALRAVVTDDGTTIVLASYRGAERLAVVELTPIRALTIAEDLVAAVRRRLSPDRISTAS